MDRFDIVVIGGGIAGLATASFLPRAAGAEVCLLEREPILAFHASGRNAGIFCHLDEDPIAVRLALRSRELLPFVEGTDGPLLRATGALYFGAAERLARRREMAERFGVRTELLDPQSLGARVPMLSDGAAERGLLVPGDGILDPHGLCQSLRRKAREAGVTIRTGASATGILTGAGRVRGVRLEGGGTLAADAVVIAAGAWAAGLGSTCGADLALEPRRRHLVMLGGKAGDPPWGPVVWRLGEEVYFRPEPGGFLASPCDEDPWPPGIPPVSPEPLARLASLLAGIAPRLAAGPVLRSWACLRTFAADRGIVAGPDPRVPGLFWVAGLGGRGMTCGLAAGEVAASVISGGSHPLAEALSPGRLLGPPAHGSAAKAVLPGIERSRGR